MRSRDCAGPGGLRPRRFPGRRCGRPRTIDARHTVGLVDPITAADQAERVDDGLPETLEEVVAAYGHRWFKLKVAGNIDADLARLLRIAAVLDRIDGGYRASLDGNEQYDERRRRAAAVAAHARRAAARSACATASIFIEQPIKRAGRTGAGRRARCRRSKPVIIDESDDSLDAFVRGRALRLPRACRRRPARACTSRS